MRPKPHALPEYSSSSEPMKREWPTQSRGPTPALLDVPGWMATVKFPCCAMKPESVGTFA